MDMQMHESAIGSFNNTRGMPDFNISGNYVSQKVNADHNNDIGIPVEQHQVIKIGKNAKR
jgi:hypothetical protein